MKAPEGVKRMDCPSRDTVPPCVLAGLTVYAVPQVLAATLPIGALSNQVGTVVKLVRVLMLGPVVLGLSLISRRPAILLELT